jgi:hypothetical protein
MGSCHHTEQSIGLVVIEDFCDIIRMPEVIAKGSGLTYSRVISDKKGGHPFTVLFIINAQIPDKLGKFIGMYLFGICCARAEGMTSAKTLKRNIM